MGLLTDGTVPNGAQLPADFDPWKPMGGVWSGMTMGEVQAHGRGIQTQYMPQGVSAKDFVNQVDAQGPFQRSGITGANGLYTPVPVRLPGHWGSNDFSQQLPGNTPYYLDAWNNAHFGAAAGNDRFNFGNLGNERSGTALLSNAWKDPAWMQANTTPLNGGFSIGRDALSGLSGQAIQNGRDNGAYAAKDNTSFAKMALAAAAAYFSGGLTSGLTGAMTGTLGATGAGIASGALVGAGTSALTGGNPLTGALMGGFGGYMNVPGGGGSYLNSGLSDIGVPASAIPYASRGLVTAGKGLLSGQSFGDSLTSGAASGFGGYAGNLAGNWANDYQLPSALTQGFGQSVAGGVGSAIRGGDIGLGMMNGGLNGFAGGLGQQFGSGMAPGMMRDFATSAPSGVMNAWLGQQQNNRSINPAMPQFNPGMRANAGNYVPSPLTSSLSGMSGGVSPFTRSLLTL